MHIHFAPRIVITINNANATRSAAYLILILKLLGFL
jgi:hypothetical protein